MQNQNSQTAFRISIEPVAPISETDVTRFLNCLETKAFLKKRLEQIDSELEGLEQDLIERIEVGAKINSRVPISIKTTERRYPSWKDAFIKIAGEAEAKKVIAATEPTVSKSIVISTK